jgi:hypothetical protein
MSAICQTASGLVRWSAAPLALKPPRRLVESLAALGPLATARLGARQFVEALRGKHRKRPVDGGGPGEPPEADPAPYNHWEDPVLWILMMH